uniref:Ig-like domain-containing protein n=1 Tax=Astyanax mexicanus TaxID=7994 RepID=A0A8B9L9H3_ASTMX
MLCPTHQYSFRESNFIRCDGYNEYTVYECIFSEALTDVEFILSYYFNKDPYIRFNSTVGKFVGYTEFGVKNAERWNKGPELQKWTTELDRYCKPNIQIDHSDILVKSVVPKIRLRLDKQGRDDHLARLICSAYDFYPSAIDVYWLKDNKKVTGDVTATEEMADGDWYYQFHSHLDYTPKSGEKISCVVEHASSTKPIITEWSKNKDFLGGPGVIFSFTGVLCDFVSVQNDHVCVFLRRPLRKLQAELQNYCFC